jgi:hypothetical protein
MNFSRFTPAVLLICSIMGNSTLIRKTFCKWSVRKFPAWNGCGRFQVQLQSYESKYCKVVIYNYFGSPVARVSKDRGC